MLLDFTVKGGQFALIPAVPYGNDFKIKNNPVRLRLFTPTRDMKGMEVSFLSPEGSPLRGVPVP